MTNMLCESAFFGVVISLLAYELGMLLKKKFGLPIFNPLLISIAVVIVFLAVFDIDYQNYNDGAKYLSYLLTPATVCLAIPLYEQMEALKKNIKAILAGILSGVLTSLTVVLALALIFNLNHKMYVTLLPKSITTAIGMGVSEELGGERRLRSQRTGMARVLGHDDLQLLRRDARPSGGGMDGRGQPGGAVPLACGGVEQKQIAHSASSSGDSCPLS